MGSSVGVGVAVKVGSKVEVGGQVGDMPGFGVGVSEGREIVGGNVGGGNGLKPM